jgi:hypothetical protein
VKARGSQVVMSCNTANYNKLYRTVEFTYPPPFLCEMKHKEIYFVAFYKLLLKSLKRENGTIYIEKMGFVLRSDIREF